MGPPGIEGRAAIFARHMAGMKASNDIDPHTLARLTLGFSGAQIELTCREAGMACVKEAVQDHIPLEAVEMRMEHFEKAISIVAGQTTNSSASKSKGNGNGVIQPQSDLVSPLFLRNE